MIGASSVDRQAVSIGVLVGCLLAAPVVAAPALGGAGSAAGGDPTGSAQPSNLAGVTQSADNPCVGTIADEPSGTTLFTIQGARAGEKTDSLMVGVHPNGSVVGVHDDTAAGRWWLYDADYVNGSLLTATTEPGITVVESVDPATGAHEWTWRLENVEDAHDVDRLGPHEYVLVDKGDERNRVVVYNRTTDEVVWEYRFGDHPELFPESGGGPYGKDWTHVNDVDAISDGTFLVSVRNFDQVIAIDRDTKEVEWRLGADDEYDILHEQHNPDFFRGEDGTATVLVADSENDRVIEYSRQNGEWVRTWSLAGDGLTEPRDADRLPNGNTLIADRRGHRILEVTPRGEVVWEFYAPWQPYDVERIGTGDESSGPTARQLGVTGAQTMSGSADFSTAEIEGCYDYLTGVNRTRLLPDDEITDQSTGTDTDQSDTATRITTQWTTVPETTESEVSGPLFGLAAAVVLLVVGLGLFVRHRS